MAPAETGEVGVFDVTLTEEVASHRLMQGLETSHKVMQWHMAEVKRVPDEARVLASSALTPVQTLAVGEPAPVKLWSARETLKGDCHVSRGSGAESALAM